MQPKACILCKETLEIIKQGEKGSGSNGRHVASLDQTPHAQNGHLRQET
jgi:hypothetical protein